MRARRHKLGLGATKLQDERLTECTCHHVNTHASERRIMGNYDIELEPTQLSETGFKKERFHSSTRNFPSERKMRCMNASPSRGPQGFRTNHMRCLLLLAIICLMAPVTLVAQSQSAEGRVRPPSARELVRRTASIATTTTATTATSLVTANQIELHHRANEIPTQSVAVNHHHHHPHQQKSPSLPPHYVKLGNNTSSHVRSHFHHSTGASSQFRHSTTAAVTTFNNQTIGSDPSTSFKKLPDKICIGTSNRLSGQSNKTDHYQNLVERYRNCTHVIGNLEITWLEREPGSGQLDLSFLESIREITGYLLIAYVEAEKIRLPNLLIIRGREVFRLNNGKKEEFAMFAIENDLNYIEMPNLREIIFGHVGFYNNRNLCSISTIDWGEILNPGFMPKYATDARVPPPKCPECHSSCQIPSCWGPEEGLCQQFSKIMVCPPQCEKGRCFGPGPRDCCHMMCAGGCTGPKQTDCFACKNFNNDGECVPECPPMNKYNPSKFLWEPDPNGKFAFGATCVKECPENMLRDSGACVRLCPPNKRSLNGECVPCGGPCPKNCQGVEIVNSNNIDQLINCTVIEGSITILDESFNGYTDPPTSSAPQQQQQSQQQQQPQQQQQQNQQQSQQQQQQSSNSTTAVRHKPMHPSRLEVFKTLREITGYLNIKAKHPDFKDLSYFINLKTIGGRQLTDMFHALSITRSSLVSLNLRSLRKVRSGKITIEENPELCFADTIDWLQLDTSVRPEDVTIRNNAESSKCRARGAQCHEQCARDGCWGPGPDECLSCNNYKLDDYCVVNCRSTEFLGFLSYEDSSQARICKRCHAECSEGCNGTEARHCHACKSVKDGPYCVPECPSHKYNNNGTCEECDKSCGPDGCTGPSNKLGEGGCNSCAKAIIRTSDFTGPSLSQQTFDIECMRTEEPCPDGYYQEYVLGSSQPDGSPLKSSSGRPVCRKCHHRCKRCIGMGTHKTVCECAKYVAGEQCEDNCPRDYYADEDSRQCVKCSPECNGCFGPTEADCLSCRIYRIYYDAASAGGGGGGGGLSSLYGGGTNHQISSAPMASAQIILESTNALNRGAGLNANQRLRFNCTAQCPPDKPHRISESNMLDPYCSEDPGIDIDSSLIASMSPASILPVIIISVALMVCFSIYRCQIERDKTYKMTMRLSGIEDVEPLTPSNMKPNLASLRSIQESELSEGKELGSGFGGTVYEGFWRPEGKEYRHAIPVAIKKLRDNGQSNINKEFLEEAYIMASVDHPNLVRLLAVCMTPKNLMLVTKLMPLGCLLDYVKKGKHIIGSKNLFEWGKQIARGMAYLEERRLVHRDLALRNVLLQTPRKALISDFGLAKFLDVDQSEYQSGGGRLPIKWLAPECFRERKFTHKSDVWAFGVTIWELLTFGQRPYEEHETRDVPLIISGGARLRQPGHVTLEVYKVMLSCWYPTPEGRPTFKSLVQSFVNFARDPERYFAKGVELYKALTCEPRHPDECDGEDHDDLYESDDDEDDGDEEDGNDEADSPDQGDSPTSLTSSQPPLDSAMAPDLTPSTHNRLNEMFGFEMQRQRASESSEVNGPSSSLTTPILKKLGMFGGSNKVDRHNSHNHNHNHNHHEHHRHSHHNQRQHLASTSSKNALIGADVNNNTTFVNGNPAGCWSMHHTVSSTSLGRGSEQPTDMYDYLLPSPPCTNELGHQFSTFYPASYGNSDALSVRNPPHSAGIVSNITNEEYFLTDVNYVNEDINVNTHHNNRTLSTSNGNIPQSLV